MYVLRIRMAASVLNMHRNFFFSLFPKRCSITIVCTAFHRVRHYEQSRDDWKCAGGCVQVACKLSATSRKALSSCRLCVHSSLNRPPAGTGGQLCLLVHLDP